MSQYPHLCEEAARVVDSDLETKNAFVRSLRFIPYRDGIAVLRWLTFLRRNEAGSDRPRSVHVVGSPGAGKSRLLRHYASLNPPRERAPSGERALPVVLVECPYESNPRRVRERMLNHCIPGFGELGLGAQSAVDMLHVSGVEQLLIDEAGNLLNGGPTHQQECLSFLKSLTNAGLTLAVATTYRWQNVLAADEQLKARFLRIELRPWAESMELRQFLAAVERQIPLPTSSHLDGMQTVRWLMAHDYTSTGSLLNVIRDAAGYAFEQGESRISAAVLEAAAAGTVPPDGRGTL